MTRVHTDLSRVAISVAPSPATSGTSLGVTDANAAYLPDTYPYWAVLVPVNAAPTRANSEIVKVTGGSSSGGTTTLTITRAQGTPVTTAKTVTTSFDIYDANSTEALGTVLSVVVNETPGGSINSSNTSFTTAASMITGTLKVYQNGIRLKGGGVDFTQGSAATFTMVTAPTTGDLLLVDYNTSAGNYSAGSTSFVYDETPSGTVNSSNTSFTIASTPVAGSLIVYRDGQRLVGGGADYTLSGTTITFVTAPTTGSTLKVDYQSAVSAAGNADTLDGFHAAAQPTASMVAVHDASGILLSPIYSPQGFLQNGKISVTVASNNLTVAIKTLAGADATAATPIYCRIGDTVRSITAALSVTKNAGTNWCNAGGAELAATEADYFAYLGYNATDGVVVGFSRYPGASQYNDFSVTTTNEKYCAISTITTAASTDYYQVIGRFAATLSAGAGYTWTVPTFTAINLKQYPIYETRYLTFIPQWTGNTTTTAGSGTFRYKIVGQRISVELGLTAFFTSNANTKTVTMPMGFASGSSTQALIFPFRGYDNTVGLTPPVVGTYTSANILTLYKDYAQSNLWTTSGSFLLQGNLTYPIA